MIKDLDFVRLNLDPLAATIQANARAWVKELGKLLNESAREELNGLKGEIEVCTLSRIYCKGFDAFTPKLSKAVLFGSGNRTPQLTIQIEGIGNLLGWCLHVLFHY